jgi:hypothetical protein
MRILLRSRETKLYYAGDGGWKAEPDGAVPFPSSLNAWKLALARREPLELVYFLDSSTETFSCPIEPPTREPQQV